ncbi:MAG: Serine phosphatase RsbU, regulator of sigma subunit [uncultured Solirubrobacteraceae bacterium]|uniref:Serine phosphatase RsbU, regulator of sigma subunit n=1 Tax=uncultured Solirubrobacteraceae bacterium TaxID=1162706 RepID=A0A6J4TGC2_9ACTN|nr:MAG: Serine phosphatase RsbU, regulator of sigma subunit [uncultured Solirubrobacteraceae bacterium]
MAATPTDAYALLDALFANAPVGLAFWDTELRYRRVNVHLAEINGIAPADHIGHTPVELLGELGRDVEPVLASVLETGKPVVDVAFEGETPAAPGQVRHWSGSFYVVPTEDGTPLGVAAVVIEVTGEREARRAQQVASALLDAVFGAAPVGIALWDLDLRLRRVNPALAEMNGLPAAEHLGHTPAELFGEIGETTMDLLREVIERGEPVVREVSGELGGRTIHREGTVFPVYGPQNEITAVAGVVREVTEFHEAEAERMRLLKEALTARAQAEAAQVRAEAARTEAEGARRRTEFLARAGERLAMVTRDFETTLQEVANVAVPVIADWCTFTLVEARGALRTVAVATADDADMELVERFGERYPPQPDATAGAGHVVRTGERELFNDIPPELIDSIAQDQEHASLLRSLGLRSGMTIPLKAGDRIIGALSLVLSRSGRSFSGDDVALAESLASRAALAVENARLYAERSHIAQTLQRSLLPPALPEIAGLELAARYRAAGSQNQVGGDFYDAFRAADGVWTLLIGDVSGKGPEAAALTSLTRHTLRAATLRDMNPRENLKLLNEALFSQPDADGRFCTVLYAQVRPRAEGGADITLATGGHLPPILLRAGGRVERVQLRGSLVGGLRTPEFGEREITLEPGDLLLLFTDGVTEIRGDDPDLGERALAEVLAQMRGASADEIVAAVQHKAVDLQAGEPRDDIALLAVKAQA